MEYNLFSLSSFLLKWAKIWCTVHSCCMNFSKIKAFLSNSESFVTWISVFAFCSMVSKPIPVRPEILWPSHCNNHTNLSDYIVYFQRKPQFHTMLSKLHNLFLNKPTLLTFQVRQLGRIMTSLLNEVSVCKYTKILPRFPYLPDRRRCLVTDYVHVGGLTDWTTCNTIMAIGCCINHFSTFAMAT